MGILARNSESGEEVMEHLKTSLKKSMVSGLCNPSFWQDLAPP